MAKQQQRHVVRNIDGVTHIVPRKKRKSVSRQTLLRLGVVCAIIVGVVAVVVIVKNVQAPPNLEKADGIKRVLSRHIVVPNETPVIATVTDKGALKTPFLQESENGDKIVIYEKARKVVIYRPSIDRVVNIGPVELNNLPKNVSQ